MKFDIISIFPEFFQGPLNCGLMKKASSQGAIKIRITNPRDFADNGMVDDYQFGGGAGMVMKPEPLVRAINKVRTKKSMVLNFTPKGFPLTQHLVHELSTKKHLIMICGRYKGIDERINSIVKPLEISIGDYVLSGGEIAALTLIETITRLLPGTIGNRNSADTDSFENHLLEPSIYTRPDTYKRHKVPNVLRSGNHRLISRWRRKRSLQATIEKRPELLPKETFSKKDFEILLEVLNG